jgi:hypothetical protein
MGAAMAYRVIYPKVKHTRQKTAQLTPSREPSSAYLARRLNCVPGNASSLRVMLNVPPLTSTTRQTFVCRLPIPGS